MRRGWNSKTILRKYLKKVECKKAFKRLLLYPLEQLKPYSSHGAPTGIIPRGQSQIIPLFFVPLFPSLSPSFPFMPFPSSSPTHMLSLPASCPLKSSYGVWERCKLPRWPQIHLVYFEPVNRVLGDDFGSVSNENVVAEANLYISLPCPCLWVPTFKPHSWYEGGRCPFSRTSPTFLTSQAG